MLHATTKQQLQQFIVAPVHAVLLTGAHGIGKGTVATSLVATLLDIPSEKVGQHPYVHLLAADAKGTISIEAIRGLNKFLQLKTIGKRSLRRAVIVEHADGLTTEAQNAYLKLLEEPPADSVMILTASSVRALLPTIRSRLQVIPVHEPADTELQAFFTAQGKKTDAVTQAYFLSGGLPGLMHALLAGDEAHPLLQGVAQAKALLQQDTFERLCTVDALSKQREDAQYTLEALSRIAQTGLRQATTRQDTARIAQWHRVRKVTHEAADALGKSANAKLVLSNLLLRM